MLRASSRAGVLLTKAAEAKLALHAVQRRALTYWAASLLIGISSPVPDIVYGNKWLSVVLALLFWSLLAIAIVVSDEVSRQKLELRRLETAAAAAAQIASDVARDCMAKVIALVRLVDPQ